MKIKKRKRIMPLKKTNSIFKPDYLDLSVNKKMSDDSVNELGCLVESIRSSIKFDENGDTSCLKELLGFFSLSMSLATIVEKFGENLHNKVVDGFNLEVLGYTHRQ